MNNTGQWSCLSCGSKGNFSQISSQGWCSNCNSKNLEVKISIHYVCLECSLCHKVKNIVYHGISQAENEIKKEQAKQNWLKTGEWCVCS